MSHYFSQIIKIMDISWALIFYFSNVGQNSIAKCHFCFCNGGPRDVSAQCPRNFQKGLKLPPTSSFHQTNKQVAIGSCPNNIAFSDPISAARHSNLSGICFLEFWLWPSEYPGTFNRGTRNWVDFSILAHRSSIIQRGQVFWPSTVECCSKSMSGRRRQWF